MSSPDFDAYLKYGDHLIHVAAVHVEGAWLSWVEFTRDRPYGEGCVHIPIYRHKVPGAFKSNPACLEAGIAYAARTIAADAIRPENAKRVPRVQSSSRH